MRFQFKINYEFSDTQIREDINELWHLWKNINATTDSKGIAKFIINMSAKKYGLVSKFLGVIKNKIIIKSKKTIKINLNRKISNFSNMDKKLEISRIL